ncbi:hypothetical protein Pmar_PMAR020497 [Perkinsus marinus ATCC 50983]|uniref:Uncharacterized protein n=1 Tax=Perkinsus marinus (strain ATCC 50983 / TXsc) TaxID=423536 RepID=C5L770_PERM5|nr:hypothetical protein Pmar_PMAR020497 [Perkinsus marinus ATCC 50983]EER07332.1 hypothetical protein Pmar_PMAR020497 [Perkinsus marinus ATCC 50983]|eukprot:XP_002775516.1 hypothetical protein Pmar_PMAR020497 [Perkinsus marinus ATCC 50983]
MRDGRAVRYHKQHNHRQHTTRRRAYTTDLGAVDFDTGRQTSGDLGPVLLDPTPRIDEPTVGGLTTPASMRQRTLSTSSTSVTVHRKSAEFL